MDIESEESSKLSDADPQFVIDSLKDMDDLDAELFGNKKKPSAKKSTNKQGSPKQQTKTAGKKVTFQPSVLDDNDDFDVEDPLAGLLSDAESTRSDEQNAFQNKTKKTVKPATKPEMKKRKESDDIIFDDNNDDLLQSLGLDEDRSKPSPGLFFKKPDVDSLSKQSAPKQPGSSPKKQTTSKSSKYRFDKDGNLVLEPAPVQEELAFGTYQPSTTSKPVRTRGGSKPPPKASGNDDFLNFLTDDFETQSRASVTKATTPIKGDSSNIAPSSGAPTSRPHDFLGLGDEVDLGSDDNNPPLPSVNSNAPPTFKPKTTPSKRKDPADVPPSPTMKSTPSPVISQPPAFPTDVSPSPARTKPASPLMKSKPEPDLFDFLETTTPSTPKSRSLPSPTLPQTTAAQRKPPLPQSLPVSSILPSSGENTAQVQSLEVQLSHARSLLHDAQLGFQSDLELTKQAYDSRVQSLQSSIHDIKSRADREVESIKESYNVRLDAVRKQIRDHFEEVSEKDLVEHEEIKRLRALHLTALEDTRLDYEHQTKLLRESHAKDIEALKASTVYVRNLDSMLQKVDGASEQLVKLSSKHEATFHATNNKWSDVMSQNKNFVSGVQERLEDMQRNNGEMQQSVQQTVSRLEGNISEMNRTLRDQQYQMQLERTRLENAQTSLDNEKKALHQQMATERAEAMKAHREAIDLRQTYERESRDQAERLRHREEELRHSQRILEEARHAEAEQSSSRERERRQLESELARQRATQAEKSEKLSALEAKLLAQKEEFDRRHQALVQLEQRLQEKEERLGRREADVKEAEQKNARKIKESAQALKEAKRVEREHESRMNELHAEASEVATQRQLLAEERKQMVEDRLKYQPSSLPPTEHRGVAAKPADRFRPAYSPRKSGSNAAMWLFTAQKDRDFLEDEEIFLETLKSPHKQGAVESKPEKLSSVNAMQVEKQRSPFF